MTDPQRPVDDPRASEPTAPQPDVGHPAQPSDATQAADDHAPRANHAADAAAAAYRQDGQESGGDLTASDATDATDAADAPDPADAAEQDTVDLDALADADPRTRAELYGALLEAEAQRDEYLDDLRRARAEFDNYRRRVMREGASQRDSGKAEAFGSLLEVLDDLERTVEASEGSDDPSLAKGLQLVASKLVSAVGSQGLTRIDAVDAPFDPNEHEAVQQQPSDEPTDEPVVTQVLRPGYRLGDRVLRPAMVVVRS